MHEDLLSVTFWLKVDTYQPLQGVTPIYVMDARYGDPEGLFSTSTSGLLWERLFVDGVSMEVSFESLPIGVWTHLHFEAHHAFSDDLNFMSHVVEGDVDYHVGNLKGLLAEVYLWDRWVLNYELAQMLLGFDYQMLPLQGLVAVYALEEGEGKRAYDVKLPTEELRLEHYGKLLNAPLCGSAYYFFSLYSRLPPPPPLPPLPPLPQGKYAVSFDGSDDYLTLPAISGGVTGLTCWLWIASVQPNDEWFLLDTRLSSEEGLFLTGQAAQGLSSVYVDAVEDPSARLEDAARDTWLYVHLEARGNWTTTATMMASLLNAADVEFPLYSMAGRLGDVALWGRPLAKYEVQVQQEGINYLDAQQPAGLLAYFTRGDSPVAIPDQLYSDKPPPPSPPSPRPPPGLPSPPPQAPGEVFATAVEARLRFSQADVNAELPPWFDNEIQLVYVDLADGSVTEQATTIVSKEAGSMVVSTETIFVNGKDAQGFVDELACCGAAAFAVNARLSGYGPVEVLAVRAVGHNAPLPPSLPVSPPPAAGAVGGSDPVEEQGWFWAVVICFVTILMVSLVLYVYKLGLLAHEARERDKSLARVAPISDDYPLLGLPSTDYTEPPPGQSESTKSITVSTVGSGTTTASLAHEAIFVDPEKINGPGDEKPSGNDVASSKHVRTVEWVSAAT
ncbi:hypothetical protein CYMTET_4673 [Cymbomonas tetramitiformis]|uniref:Transmembrane protein n=1 Tax=Cymbomonas tetramitiformis TaxID=36881 RepID=A0AAE0LJW4_9CHLO|nr:hypothetical protein CYMTET_4673 [Cymbomonas tetramitiformis]